MTTITRPLPLTLHWLVVSHPDGRRPTILGRWSPEPDPPRPAALADDDPAPTVMKDAA